MSDLLRPYQHQTGQAPAEHHYYRPPAHKKRKSGSAWFMIVKTVFFVFLIIVAGILTLVGINLKPLAAASTSLSGGKANLESALATAKTGDFETASKQAEQAAKQFSEGSNELAAIKLGPLARFAGLGDYRSDAGHLARAGQHLAEAMTQSTGYAYSLEDIIGNSSSTGFSKLPITEKRRILSAIYNADGTLDAVQVSLDESLKELEQAKSFETFSPIRSRVDELKMQIVEGKQALAGASPLTRLLPPLLGYPDQATYLFILQNSDELRATGGFIGTYGIVQAKDGDFTRFETHDIYHLDMPVKDKVKVEPPEPLKKYLNKQWYLRDANWYPDWPTSAEKILWFYGLENNAQAKPDPIKEFDGVIAITPELITELMRLTGPIVVEGQTYTPENFVDLLQYRVEQGYVKLGESSWQRKEVVAEIAKQVKEKLVDLPLSRWNELIRVVGDNMARKNLLLYARDPALQKLIRAQGWSGELRQDWGDYLMVVDSNMAALKTDAVMERQIDYRLEQETDGRLLATVTLNYFHRGGLDWKTSRYQSYTRIYVPQGSVLVRSSGGAAGSQTSGDENGRSYFGTYLTVPPRGTGQVLFQYRLPKLLSDNLNEYKNYGLLIQKQPGAGSSRLTVDASFHNRIQSYEPSNLSTTLKETNRFSTTGDLKIDRRFLIKF